MRPASLPLRFFIPTLLLCIPLFSSAQVTNPFSQTNQTTSSETEQIAELQAQISDLLATISALQAQILAASGGGTVGSFGYTFTIKDWGFRGYKGESYRWLQKALNRLGYTVAASGPGSRSNETAYFGSATEAALQTFQRDNNIVSSGSPQTTGYGALGPSTRSKLNQLLAKKTTTNTNIETETIQEQNQEITQNQNQNQNQTTNTGQTTSNTDTSTVDNSLSSGSIGLGLSTSGSTDDTFRAGAFSTYQASVGTAVVVNGNNFTNNTIVRFDEREVSGTANTSGTLFTFTVPNITPGYYVPIFEDNGVEATRRADFVITNPNAEPPELYTISPSIGEIGTTITLRGKNFTATNNTINLGFDLGVIEGVTSLDSETLTFTLDSSDLPSDFLLESANGTNEFPVTLRVINANGMSEDTMRFIIRM